MSDNVVDITYWEDRFFDQELEQTCEQLSRINEIKGLSPKQRRKLIRSDDFGKAILEGISDLSDLYKLAAARKV